MAQPETIAVIGAGVIGSAVACVLALEGRRVLLMDRDAPGEAGASFGNAGHIATELVEPLPSPGLLLGFWRLLTILDGPLHIPARRVPAFLPWASRFAAAAFRRRANTPHLAAFVRPSADALETLLQEIGRAAAETALGQIAIDLKAARIGVTTVRGLVAAAAAENQKGQ